MIDRQLNLILLTTTRADWGILSPLARALDLRPDVRLTVAATNMHLSPTYGNTVDEIRADGLSDVVTLSVPEVSDSALSRAEMTGALSVEFAKLIDRARPDAVIMLGDRFELLGAATAAVITNVPIVHLHGGEVTMGAIDDAVRHALSKLASLHLVATEQARQNLIAMGEQPSRIVHTGAIGVENALSAEKISLDALRQSLDGFDIDPERTLLVTYHPVTRHPAGLPTLRQVDNLLEALDRVSGWNAIITFPNNDTGSDVILRRLDEFAQRRPADVKLVKSLGKTRYLSALRHVRAVVGNSSSGIIEAPSIPVATLDIGPRQDGRERASSVIHVDDDTSSIEKALRSILAEPRPLAVAETVNPYYRENAVDTAVKAITELLPTLSLTKQIYT